MWVVDLNCDLGEGAPDDEALLAVVTSVNVACGAHAGDLPTMRRVAALAASLGVSLGAHPGYADRPGFGRRNQNLDTSELRELVASQIARLQGCGPVRHVKPHGALYNQSGRDLRMARTIAETVFEADPSLVLFGGAGSALLKAGREVGLQVASEVFADRSYQSDGSLTPRGQPGAMIDDEGVAVARVVQMIAEGWVGAVDGTRVPVVADTICVHGDEPGARDLVARMKQGLLSAGVTVRPFER